jgi:major membrane immunogen (membrane-anchored lipoprotein)
MDSGFARNWDDKYWFDHLTLQKDDGELTTVTMDEYTELRRIVAHQTK